MDDDMGAYDIELFVFSTNIYKKLIFIYILQKLNPKMFIICCV